jgi:hypothetical protein
MWPDLSNGVMTTCRLCGGESMPTGNTRHARSRRPSINSYVSLPVRIVELRCGRCGNEDWLEDGVAEAQ